jgi:hypothetical protein
VLLLKILHHFGSFLPIYFFIALWHHGYRLLLNFNSFLYRLLYRLLLFVSFDYYLRVFFNLSLILLLLLNNSEFLQIDVLLVFFWHLGPWDTNMHILQPVSQ